MKRMTIRLPDNLAAALGREGRRRDMPMSEIARDAIALHLAHLEAEKIVDGKRILPFMAIGRSKGDGNTARDIDEILAREGTIEKLIDPYRSAGEAGVQERSGEDG